ncbi:hypothetical protein EYR41_008500 [Orbilia oligospora]|uniref:Uncharacterized protein n=1 Tax=Orbilia oligospora TaxID=2813651 RepID=A0A8H2DU34_ORBOL|nr:hypothetical protein EYR41_008500 [Orbilia oligospora]
MSKTSTPSSLGETLTTRTSPVKKGHRDVLLAHGLVIMCQRLSRPRGFFREPPTSVILILQAQLLESDRTFYHPDFRLPMLS